MNPGAINAIDKGGRTALYLANDDYHNIYNKPIKELIESKLAQYSVDKLHQLNKDGVLKFGSKQYYLAIEEFNKAINLIEISKIPTSKNDHETILYNRARTHGEQGDVDKAINDYVKAIEINNNNAKAYQYLGICYMHKNNLDQAQCFLRWAIEKDSTLQLAKQELQKINLIIEKIPLYFENNNEVYPSFSMDEHKLIIGDTPEIIIHL